MPTVRTSPPRRGLLAWRPEPGEVILGVWSAIIGIGGLVFSFYAGLRFCEGCGSGSINLCGPSLAPDDLACTLVLLPAYAVLWGTSALIAAGVVLPTPWLVLLALAAAALAGGLGGAAVAWWIRRH
jgi:hypothetical protein